MPNPNKNDPAPVIPLFSDPTVPRSLEQSAARYNEESASTTIEARRQFLFQQQANNAALLKQSSEIADASFLAKIQAIKELLKERS